MLDYLRIVLNGRLAHREQDGASAVEYALLIAGIAALLVLVIYAFGGMLVGVFSGTCQNIGTHAGAANSC
jgi:pilus assembly protein Flp/PilA